MLNHGLEPSYRDLYYRLAHETRQKSYHMAYDIRSCPVLQLPRRTVIRPLISICAINSHGLAGKIALTKIIGCHLRGRDWCGLVTELYHRRCDSTLSDRI